MSPTNTRARFILLSRDRYTCIVFHDKRPAPRRKDASSSSPRFSPSFPYLLITLNLYLSTLNSFISSLIFLSAVSRLSFLTSPEREFTFFLIRREVSNLRIAFVRFSMIQLEMISQIYMEYLYFDILERNITFFVSIFYNVRCSLDSQYQISFSFR